MRILHKIHKKHYIKPTVSFEPIDVDAVMDSPVQGSIPRVESGDVWEEPTKAFRGDFVFEQEVFPTDGPEVTW